MNVKVEIKPYDTSSLLSAIAVKKNGDGGDFGALLKGAETKPSDAALELEKYAKMTPAQRMAAAILKSMGISQEQFNAMSPDQKAAVTAKIAEIMKQQMEEKMAGSQATSSL